VNDCARVLLRFVVVVGVDDIGVSLLVCYACCLLSLLWCCCVCMFAEVV
jgi:hypothetical protein